VNRSAALALCALLAVAVIAAWVALRPAPGYSSRVPTPQAPPSLDLPTESKPAARAPVAGPAVTTNPGTKPPGAPRMPAVLEDAASSAPGHRYLPDRAPDQVLADGTQVYNNYPFQMKQPDGTYQTVLVTVTFKPVPAAPVEPEHPKDR
jgi:hypothetical protein